MGRENPTPAAAGAKPLVGGDESTLTPLSYNVVVSFANSVL